MTGVRTCEACGGRDPKRTMHRLVRADARLEIDPTQRRAGRGAYVHPAAACLTAFARRRGPVRSLRWTPSAAERARVAQALGAGTPGER